MNLILLFEQDYIANDTVKLSDARFEQIRHIHQSKIGDRVRVGELNGLTGSAIINNIDNTSVELSVDLKQPPPKKLPLKVILALPRPKMVRRIFRSIAELGIGELIIINSYKVEKSFWSSPALEESNVQDYLINGLQQAKDTQLPKVSFHRLFKPFVEDVLPSMIDNNQRCLIAHPGTSSECPQPLNTPAIIAIGPEGGFTDYEVGKFNEAGFESIQLGERILRVENAITALASKLYS